MKAPTFHWRQVVAGLALVAMVLQGAFLATSFAGMGTLAIGAYGSSFCHAESAADSGDANVPVGSSKAACQFCASAVAGVGVAPVIHAVAPVTVPHSVVYDRPFARAYATVAFAPRSRGPPIPI
jgi:hypothetical protein